MGEFRGLGAGRREIQGGQLPVRREKMSAAVESQLLLMLLTAQVDFQLLDPEGQKRGWAVLHGLYCMFIYQLHFST